MVDDKIVLVIEKQPQPRRGRQRLSVQATMPKLAGAAVLALSGAGLMSFWGIPGLGSIHSGDVPVSGASASEEAGLSGLKLSSMVASVTPSPLEPLALVLPGASVSPAGAILAADLNGDGLPELITANSQVPELSIRMQRAPDRDRPVFGEARVLALGAPATMLASGDIDGDGLLDLVAASATSTSINLLINATHVGGDAGHGRSTHAAEEPTFQATRSLNLDSPPSAVLLTEVSGDRMADLVALQRLDHETDLPISLAVRVNISATGNAPEFAPPRRFQTGYFANGLAAADFDGDGRTDLAVSNGGSGTITVLRNSSMLTVNFTIDQTLAARRGVGGIIAGDVDGDDRPDLIVVEPADDRVALYRNQSGRYDDPLEVPANAASAVALADLRGDARPELIVAHGGDGGVGMRVDVAPHGSLHPRFLPEITLLAPGAEVLMIASDLDADRRVELALQPVEAVAASGDGDATEGQALAQVTPISLFRHPFQRSAAPHVREMRRLIGVLPWPAASSSKALAAELPRRATQ